MHGHAMHTKRSEQLHRALAVLAPPRRFELLMLLLTGVDRSVSQLAAAVGLSQSCTTRHLQALERAGLVKGLRDGKRVVFRPEPRDAAGAGVLASLAGQWSSARPARRVGKTARDRRTSGPGPSGLALARGRRGEPPARPWRTGAFPAEEIVGTAPYSDVPGASDDQPDDRPYEQPVEPTLERLNEPPSEQPDAESDKNRMPSISRPWDRQELEDYLL